MGSGQNLDGKGQDWDEIATELERDQGGTRTGSGKYRFRIPVWHRKVIRTGKDGKLIPITHCKLNLIKEKNPT